MSLFLVTISLRDGTQSRTYGGDYGDAADAAFGCMRKAQIERSREVSATMPLPANDFGPGGLFAMPREEREKKPDWKRYIAAQRRHRQYEAEPKLVEVRLCDHRIPKKVHRVA